MHSWITILIAIQLVDEGHSSGHHNIMMSEIMFFFEVLWEKGPNIRNTEGSNFVDSVRQEAATFHVDAFWKALDFHLFIVARPAPNKRAYTCTNYDAYFQKFIFVLYIIDWVYTVLLSLYFAFSLDSNVFFCTVSDFISICSTDIYVDGLRMTHSENMKLS